MTKQMLMQRNSEGLVTFANGVQVTIPEDRSMLSLVNNQIIDGSVYSSDFWVYKDGKKIKKWFIKIDDHNIWEPSLYNLPEFEQRRYNIALKCNDKIKVVWEESIKLLKEVKISIVKRHGYLTKVEYDEERKSASWTWIFSDESSKECNPEAGKAYFKADKTITRYLSYTRLFNYAFIKAVEKYIDDNNLLYDKGPWNRQQYMNFNINNREYLFKISPFEIISYPEDEQEVIVNVKVN
jgi:hypothetical protein